MDSIPYNVATIACITVFYNHFVPILRTFMSFFTTLETKLTTNDVYLLYILSIMKPVSPILFYNM